VHEHFNISSLTYYTTPFLKGIIFQKETRFESTFCILKIEADKN